MIKIITSIPSPYRINLFRYISEEINIKVLYTDINEKGRRKWKIDFGSDYNYKLLSKIRLKRFEFSYELINEIKNSELVIIGGYGLPIMQQAILLCRLMKKKYILWTDGGIFRDESTIKKRMKQFYIKNANGYLTTGIKGKEQLIYYGADKQKICTIPLTGDTDILHNQCKEFRKSNDHKVLKKKLKLNEIVILNVSETIKEKGIFELIEAFNLLQNKFKNISLLNIGSGLLDEEIKNNLKEEMSDNIHFTGFIQPTEMYKYYSISDVFILPTHRDHWGLVINEAMACKLPVISTNMACASYELIRDGYNGFMIPAKDTNAIVEKVSYLIDNDKIKEFGENGYRIIKNINNKMIARKHIKIIREII